MKSRKEQHKWSDRLYKMVAVIVLLSVLFGSFGVTFAGSSIATEESTAQSTEAAFALNDNRTWSIHNDPFWGFSISYPSTWSIQPDPYRDFGFRINSPNLRVDVMGNPISGSYLTADLVDSEQVDQVLGKVKETTGTTIAGHKALRLSGFDDESFPFTQWEIQALDRLHLFRLVSSDSVNHVQHLGDAKQILDTLVLTGEYSSRPLPISSELLDSFVFPSLKHAFQSFDPGTGKIIADYSAVTHTGGDSFALDMCPDSNCARNGLVVAPTDLKLVLSRDSSDLDALEDFHIFELAEAADGTRLCMSMGHFAITLPGFTPGKTVPRGAVFGRLQDFKVTIPSGTVANWPHIHMGLWTNLSSCGLKEGRSAVPFVGQYQLDGIDYPENENHKGKLLASTNSPLCAIPTESIVVNASMESAMLSSLNSGCIPELPSPSLTDDATLLYDNSVPPSTLVSPGQSLSKSWRIRNSGITTWNSGYQLVHVDGERMGAPTSVDVPISAPGQDVDIGVPLYAPAYDGDYTGYWQLRNPQGTYFGPKLRVNIVVKSSNASDRLTMFDISPVSPSEATSVHVVGRARYSPEMRSMRFVLGNEVHEMTNFKQVGDQWEISADWNTSSLPRGDYTLMLEVANHDDPNWASAERWVKNYTLAGTPAAVGRPPDRPILASPYDWYLKDASGASAPVRMCVNPASDPDGDSVSYYFEVKGLDFAYIENSGWISSNCWEPTLSPALYEWRAKAGDGVNESDWSQDTWHFSVAKGGVYIGDINFFDQNTNDTHMCVMVTHDGIQAPEVRAWINEATDGSDSGEWRLLDHYGPNTTPDCTQSNYHGFWIRSPEYETGNHRIRISAVKQDSGSNATKETNYSIAYIRPPAPVLVAPSSPENNGTWWNDYQIAFRWNTALRTEGQQLRVSTNQDLWNDPLPLVDVTLGPSVVSYTHVFDQDYAQLFWGIKASNSAGAADSGNGNWLGIDHVNPTCTVASLPAKSLDSVFQVDWSGTDDAAGIRSYDIQYKDSERGTWEDWLTTVPADKQYELFNGQPGHTYTFRCRSTDHANNTGPYPVGADTLTMVDPTARPPTPWLDEGWAQKRNITILNNMSGLELYSGYPVHLHFDDTTTPTAAELYASSLSSPKCNDLRIVANDATEIHRVVANCSSSAIDIWFRSQVGVPAGSSDSTTHQIYYGNASALLPLNDPGEVWYPYKEADTLNLYYLQEGVGSIAYDASGNGRNCSINTSVNWTEGKFGHGLRFNRANYGDTRSLKCGSAIPSSAFTLEFWYKAEPDDGGRIAGELAGGGNGGGGNNWLLQMFEGKIRLDTWECSTCGSQEVRSNFNLRDAQYVNKWNHVAVTFNGGNQVKFYINGRLDSTKYLQDSGINRYTPPLEIGSAEGIGQIKARLGTFRKSSGVKTSFPYGRYGDVTSEPKTALGDVIDPPITGNIDLVILDLQTFPNPDGGEIVQAVVQNQGDLSTQNGFYTDLYLDHVPAGAGDYSGSLKFWVNDPIEPTQAVTLTTVITDASVLSAPMQTADSQVESSAVQETLGTLYAQTDSAGALGESDEVNNIFSAGTPICTAGEDAYEDDDSPALASIVAVAETQSHNFSKMADEDWIKFEASAGRTYVLQTSGLAVSADTYLNLYDTDGMTLLASNDDASGSLASTINWVAPANGTYYVMIRHWNPNVGGCGTSYDFRIVAPPQPPTDLQSVLYSQSQVDLYWTDNADNEVGYRVERSVDGQTWAVIDTLGPDATTYSDTGLVEGTTYHYRVVAFNDTGEGYSDVVTVTTPSRPAAPTGLTAEAISHSQIDLTWDDNASNEDGFHLERSEDGILWQVVKTLAPDMTRCSDTDLTPETTYLYRLLAFNQVGDSPYSDEASATTLAQPITVDDLALADIIGAGAVSGSYQDTLVADGQAQAITERQSGGKPANRYSYLEHTWQFNVTGGDAVTFLAIAWGSDTTDGDTFTFAYSIDGLTYHTMFTVSGNTASEYVYSLPPGTRGGLTVRVTDSDQTPGNNNLDTIFVDHMVVRSESGSGSPPAAPTDLSATVASAHQIDLQWTDNASDEYGFDVLRSLDGQSWTVVETLSADVTSFSDLGLEPSTTYHYQVQAFNGAGSSVPSNVANAKTDAAPEPGLIHIGDLDALGLPGKPNRWDATVTITVHDENHNPVFDVTVTGAWGGALSGADTCVTDSSGQCQVTRSNIKNNAGNATFSVTALELAGYTYASSFNHDMDGDSDGTVIEIARP